MKTKKVLFTIIIIIVSIIYSLLQAKAQTQESESTNKTLIINEVMPKKDPNNSYCPNEEWIELYNNSDDEINLDNFLIDDLLDDFANNKTNGSSAKTILNKTIAAKGFLIICLGSSFLNDTGDFAYLLSNDLIILDSLSFDKSFDDLSYSLCQTQDIYYEFRLATPSAGTANNCQNDNPNSSTEESNLQNADPTETPTPTNTTVEIPTPSADSSPKIYKDLIITEVYPAPNTGETEWVEIYNPYDHEVELLNYYIDDIPQGSQPIEFSVKIPSRSYFVVELPKNILNNSQDTARLLDFNQNPISELSYSSTVKGQSWIRDKNQKICLADPTKAKDNPLCPEDKEDKQTENNNLKPTTIILKTETKPPTTPTATAKNTIKITGNTKPIIKTSFPRQPENNQNILGIQTRVNNFIIDFSKPTVINSLNLLAIYIFYLWTKTKKSV
ncbi:MAG: hypothetical protein KatS3mg090_0179 [Patescibacteria group bacterium]|nr:MAG: hypothetical protein KatS3mg090_0179 [Patescibacteria group bacterium]